MVFTVSPDQRVVAQSDLRKDGSVVVPAGTSGTVRGSHNGGYFCDVSFDNGRWLPLVTSSLYLRVVG